MRLLFITATRVGDAVLSTGLLGHLLERHPQARVTVAAGRPAAPLFEAVPGLERLLVLDKKRFAGHWLKLWTQVAGRPWDLVVDLRASALPYFLLTGQRIVARQSRPERNRVAELGDLLKLAEPPSPRVWLREDDRRAAAVLLPQGAPILALAPAANWRGKQWPADRFAALARNLTGPEGPLCDARIMVLAAAQERPQITPLLEAIPEARRIDLVGRTDLLTAAACLAEARVFVGNDSGLMHLAAAVGCPTLGLFGPSRDSRYAPWGDHCAVVRTPETFEALMNRAGPDLNQAGCLMEGLTVSRVRQAAEILLRQT